MNTMERQLSNVEMLLQLIKENPTLRIIPMVDSEVVADDSFSCWIGEWGKASIEDIYSDDERVYIRSNDKDTLIENLVWIDEFTAGLSEDEAINKAEKVVNGYEWEKVIAVKITI